MRTDHGAGLRYFPQDTDMKNSEIHIARAYRFHRPNICSRCGDDGRGGACCKQYPGGSHPTEWGAPDQAKMRQRLLRAFRTGKWALDWWEGRLPSIIEDDHRTCYYVRPAIKGKEGQLQDGAWYGECTFLTPTGCTLPHKRRPLECRALEPVAGGPERCKLHAGGKHDLALAWLPYNALLESINEGEQDEKG